MKSTLIAATFLPLFVQCAPLVAREVFTFTGICTDRSSADANFTGQDHWATKSWMNPAGATWASSIPSAASPTLTAPSVSTPASVSSVSAAVATSVPATMSAVASSVSVTTPVASSIPVAMSTAAATPTPSAASASTSAPQSQSQNDVSSTSNSGSGSPSSGSTTASCEGTGNACEGDVTYWTGGLGACGTNVDTNSDYAIALPYEFMGTLSNTNPYCGRSVTLYNPGSGTTVSATVRDKCMGCVDRAIDCTELLFNAITDGQGNGREHGIVWWLN